MKDIAFINPINHSKTMINPVALQVLENVCNLNGYSTEIIDLQMNFIREKVNFDFNTINWLRSQLKEKPAKMYGITVMNASFYWSKLISNILKDLYPDAIVFMGGPHITGLKHLIFQEIICVDYLLLYEGEETILKFIKYINAKDNILPTNVIKRGIAQYSAVLTNIDLSKDRLLNYKNYLELKILDVEVGRACAFNCYYCSSRSLLGNNVRYRNIEDILKESQNVFDNMNAKTKVCINFTHDNFLSTREIFREFVNKKLLGNYNFSYGCGGRIDLIDDEIIKLLVKSGCKYIFIGIETGSEKIQKICRKGLDLSTIKRKIMLLTKNSIYVEANFIIGFPEENRDDLYNTLKLISEVSWISPLVNVGFSYMSPEPCTDIYNNMNEEDFVLVKNSQYYKELKSSGMLQEELNPRFYNHVYTIYNQNYNIIRYVETGWKYLELLRRYYVTLQIFFKIHKIDLIIAFEQLAETDNEDMFIKHLLIQYKEQLTDIEIDVIKYEMDRNQVKKGLLNERHETARFAYNFPVQKLYKNFLLDSDTYKTWVNVVKEKVEIIKTYD